MDLEMATNTVLMIAAPFFGSQPWFQALKSILMFIVPTMEAAAANGKIEKDKKKEEAMKALDKACKKFGVYKSVPQDFIHWIAGPAIDGIILLMNTFAPGWEKSVKVAS